MFQESALRSIAGTPEQRLEAQRALAALSAETGDGRGSVSRTVSERLLSLKRQTQAEPEFAFVACPGDGHDVIGVRHFAGGV